jgi:hypothetical protein
MCVCACVVCVCQAHKLPKLWCDAVTVCCAGVCVSCRLPESVLKSLAHRHEDEEVTSIRGSSGSSNRAAVCDDPAAIKAARIRQGLLVLMVSENGGAHAAVSAVKQCANRVTGGGGMCCWECSEHMALPVCCCWLAA